MSARLRIVTYNIHRGLSPFRKKEVLDNITAVIRSTEADVLCLQEDITNEMFESSEIEWRCREVWENAVYGETVQAKGSSQGNTILSRFPMTRSNNIDISADFGEPRRALACELKLDGGQLIQVCCTHLGLTKIQRRTQAAKLVDFLKNVTAANEAMILAGDFNDWQLDLSSYFQEKLGLEEAHLKLHGRHCRTYPAWLPMLKLDRIYYRQLTPKTAWRVASFGGRGYSDHLPLVVDFHPPWDKP